MIKTTILKNKRAGLGDAVVDVLVLAIIIFIIAVFFVFMVKFAAKETNLNLEANRVKLDLTYELLIYLRLPVDNTQTSRTTDTTFAQAIEEYFITKDPQLYAQLQEFYEQQIAQGSSRCKTITVEKKMFNNQINILSSPFEIGTEQMTLGSCKMKIPLKAQVVLPLYDKDNYLIVEYSVDIAEEVSKEVIKKYFKLVS